MIARPLISVILPVRNEASFIERALDSVLAQTWGEAHLEVLVVDGRSTDATRELAERRLLSSGVARWAILDNPGQIAPCALNLGIAAARGTFVARVDGHAELDAAYLENGMRHLEETGVDGVGGRLETVGEGPSAEAIAAAMSSSFGVGGAAFRLAAGDTGSVVEADTVAFPLYRRDTLARVGAFDESFVRNQDDEYNFRLRKLGGRLLLAADMRVRYFSRARFGRLARQYFEYGVYKVRVARLHPRQLSPRHLAPAALVGGLAAGAIALPWSIGPLVALLALYLSAIALATLVVGARRDFLAPGRWTTLARLPVAFALLHLAYGTGCWVGLFRLG